MSTNLIWSVRKTVEKREEKRRKQRKKECLTENIGLETFPKTKKWDISLKRDRRNERKASLTDETKNSCATKKEST